MVDQLLTNLQAVGLLGVLLALAIVSISVLYKELRDERASRIKDLKEIMDADGTFRKEISTFMQTIRDLLAANK
jgi:hypothetical protein